MRAFASQKGPGKGLPASGFAPDERLRERFVVGTRLHFHELVEFQRGRCGDDMKCVRPDQEMRALYRFLRRHPCIGLALDPVRGGRPRAQPVVFVVARTECE